MFRLIGAVAWMIGMAASCAVLMVLLGFSLFGRVFAWRASIMIAGFGAECGVVGFVVLVCFGCLPGTRRVLGPVRPFGIMQGLWSMAGFGLMMAATALLTVNIMVLQNFFLIWRHSARRVSFTGHDFSLTVALAAEFGAALWVAWYLRRIGTDRVTDGSAFGVGWIKAPRRAYAEAMAYAGGIIGVVMGLYHLFPPNLEKLTKLPTEQLFLGPSVTLVPIFFVFVFVGPILEEFVFRGIAFAGIAASLGPAWAGIFTTLAFMAAHAPEKIYYPLGFIDVGLMATASVVLRLKYRSIRPGMVLHIIYNGGAMLAAALLAS